MLVKEGRNKMPHMVRSICMKCSERQTHGGTTQVGGCQWLEGGRNGKQRLMDSGVSSWGDRNILELDGDSRTTL